MDDDDDDDDDVKSSGSSSNNSGSGGGGGSHLRDDDIVGIVVDAFIRLAVAAAVADLGVLLLRGLRRHGPCTLPCIFYVG